MSREIFKCCLCGRYFAGHGNNPDGAVYKDEKGEIVFPAFKEDDRCCDECDNKYVTVGRMYRMQLAREKSSKPQTQPHDFCDDAEKMADFKTLSKEEFLKSYSYLTEEEYDATAKKVRGE